MTAVSADASLLMASPSSAAIGTPSTYTMRLRPTARRRSPAVTMPTRFRGSAVLMTIGSPSCRRRRTSRSCSTASGSANCSPDRPLTKRPPRIFSARLEPAIHPRQLTPGDDVGFASEQSTNDDAVAAEKRPGLNFDSRLACVPAGLDGQRRPSAGKVHPAIPGHQPSTRSPHQRTQSREAIRHRESRRHQRSDRLPQIVGVEVARRSQIGEERRAAPPQDLEHAHGTFRQVRFGYCRSVIVTTQQMPCVGVLAKMQRDGRRRHEPRRRRRIPLRHGESRPRHFPGKTQHVEHLRVVRVEPGGQDVALPGSRRELEAVELRHDLAQAVEPGQL